MKNTSGQIWKAENVCQYKFDCEPIQDIAVETECDPTTNREIDQAIFYENFQNIVLQESTNFSQEINSNAAYTQNIPGWTIDNSGVDPNGCYEFQGFTVVNREFWQFGGDSNEPEGRTNFDLGTCSNFLLADNDNYNCGFNQGKQMDTVITSPIINVSFTSINELFLIFDNTWRVQNNAYSSISISYDGGPFTEIFIQDTTGPHAAPTVWGQSIIVPAFNPIDATTIQLQFRYFDLNNGWWWGISRLGLITFPCKAGYEDDGYGGLQCIDATDCIEIGTGCFTQEKIDQCYTYLGTLTEDTVSNDCDSFYDQENNLNYKVTIQLDKSSFEFDPSCLEVDIQLQSSSIDVENYNFDSILQQFTFDIQHSQLESLNCQVFDNENDFVWQCNISIEFLFAGSPQLKYNFVMKSILNKQTNAAVQVTIQPNLVTGDCCTNTLGVDTELKFCKTYACDEYHDVSQQQFSIERLGDIFLEHSITTQEFDYLFLHYVQIKIGPFFVDVIKMNGINPGRIIYHIQSNIAFPSSTISVISKLDDNVQANNTLNRRRNLQTDQDNFVKNDLGISIVEKTGSEQQKQQNNEQQQQGTSKQQFFEKNINLIMTVAGVLLALVLIGICIVICYYKRIIRKNKKGQKTQQQQQKLPSQKSQQQKIQNQQLIKQQSSNTSKNKQQQQILNISQSTEKSGEKEQVSEKQLKVLPDFKSEDIEEQIGQILSTKGLTQFQTMSQFASPPMSAFSSNQNSFREIKMYRQGHKEEI